MHPLDAHEIELALYADTVPGGDFVTIFHEWIRSRRLEDELLIDVADYSHMRLGPGVILMGHETSYAVASVGQRLSLVCRRKRRPAPHVATGLREALYKTLRACSLLEKERALEGSLSFRTNELRLRILNRRLAPNHDATYEAVRHRLEPLIRDLYGAEGPIDIDPLPYSQEPFGVRIQIAAAPELRALLANVA